MNRKNIPAPDLNNGFTLIEVLIAMLIVAIGLMSIAALQFRGLQYSHDAYLRSQVNILAYDMADRIRLNRNDAPDYDAQVTNYTIPVTRPAGCVQTGAGSMGDVLNDVACWREQLYDALPPGSTADISRDVGNNLFTIELKWTDRDGTEHPVTFTFDPGYRDPV